MTILNNNITTKKRKNGLQNKKRSDYIFCWALLIWPIIQVCITYIAVNCNSVILAFQSYDINMNTSFAGFENFKLAYLSLFSTGGSLLSYVKNSAILFVAINVLGFPINMLFAFYICKKVRGSTFLRYCLMIPSIVSSMIIALLFIKVISVDGPVNGIIATLGLERISFLSTDKSIMSTIIFYMLWTGFASTIIYYPNAMNSVGSEVIESSHIDGANDMAEFWYIRLPLIYPTITTFVVTGMCGILITTGPLFAFFEYDAPSGVWTTGYYFFRTVMGPGASERSYPVASAAGLIVSCIAAPITYFVKWLMENHGPSED